MPAHCKQKPAFTLVELLVLLAILALLAVMLLPALAATKPKVQKVNCLNNLMQVGLALRAWEGGHGGKFPMAVSYTAGGASEYLTHSTGTVPPGTQSVTYCPGMVFMVLSNEFSAAAVLHCPADTIHPPATNFSYPALLGENTPFNHANATTPNSLSAISYFVGADAAEADPRSILAGDCNIGTAGPTTGNQPAAWRFGNTSAATPGANPGPQALGQAMGTTAVSATSAAEWAWTTNDLHWSTGNLLLGDGSVQSTTVASLKLYLQNATTSVADPVANFIW